MDWFWALLLVVVINAFLFAGLVGLTLWMKQRRESGDAS